MACNSKLYVPSEIAGGDLVEFRCTKLRGHGKKGDPEHEEEGWSMVAPLRQGMTTYRITWTKGNGVARRAERTE